MSFVLTQEAFENAEVSELIIRSIAKNYLLNHSQWYARLRHRNHKVAQYLASIDLPDSNKKRLILLARTLLKLPNLKGQLACAIKKCIAEVLNTEDPDAYLHVLFMAGIDVKRIQNIGRIYLEKHQSYDTSFWRFIHGNQSIAREMIEFEGESVPAWNWLYLASIYRKISEGWLSSAINQLFIREFGIKTSLLIKKLDLFTYKDRFNVEMLNHAIREGDTSEETEERLRASMMRSMPTLSNSNTYSIKKICGSFASTSPTLKIVIGGGIVGGGSAILLGTLAIGGITLPILLVGGTALAITGAATGAFLIYSHQLGDLLKDDKTDFNALEVSFKGLVNSYVGMSMFLGYQVNNLRKATEDLKLCNEKYDALTAKHDALNQEHSELNEEQKLLQDELMALKDELEKKISNLSELETKYEEQNSIYTQTSQVLANQLLKNQGLIANLNDGNQELKIALQSLENTKKEYEKLLKDVTNRMEKLHQEQAEMIEQRRQLNAEQARMLDEQRALQNTNPNRFFAGNQSLYIPEPNTNENRRCVRN